MTPAERRIEVEAALSHVPWWEYVDVLPIGLLIDEQKRSLTGHFLYRIERDALVRAPGAYGAAEGG